MSEGLLETGKLPTALLRELLADAPPLPKEVLLGPRIGEDACAIEVPAGTLIAATDPITLTGAEVGAHAVVINANDVAVMGVRPRWFLAAILLPESTAVSEVRALFAGMRRALRDVGADLVGGHSEVTSVVGQPVVVGQMLGLAENGRYVRTGGATAGDLVLQVGAVPIEAAAVLASELPERLADVDPNLCDRARRAATDPGLSVVEPALLAAELGATSLHDPTEGGLASGLHELAFASEVGMEVDPERILWFEPGRAVCEQLGADPWGALASGSLLATFPGPRAAAALETLRARGYPARQIARVVPGSRVERRDGVALARFERDEVARILGEIRPESTTIPPG
ncbi:MAG: AIR synthase-related protein [Myxococcota bacterium]